MRTTKYNREDLDKLWLTITTSEQPDAIKALENLSLLVRALFSHVDDLQGEVNGLKKRIEREDG